MENSSTLQQILIFLNYIVENPKTDVIYLGIHKIFDSAYYSIMLNSVSYSIMLHKLWSIDTTTVVWKCSLKNFYGNINETQDNTAAERLLEEMKAISYLSCT